MTSPMRAPRTTDRAHLYLPALVLACLLTPGCAATANPRTHALAEIAPVVVAPAESLPTAAPRADEPVIERPADSVWEKYSVTLGGIFAGVDSSVRFGLPGTGVEIDIEEALGFEKGVTSVRAGGSWRFTDNRRHRFDVVWVDLSRDSNRTIRRDVDLGNGVLLPAGTGVKSTFDLQLFRTEYSYSFLQDERLDFAGIFGLYVAPIDFEFVASGLSTASDSFDVTAPLPLAGLRMDVLLTPKTYLRSSYSLLYLEAGDFTGSIQDLLIAFEWVPIDGFGVGIGMDTFGLAVEAEGSTAVPGVDEKGSVDFGYQGITLYLKGLF